MNLSVVRVLMLIAVVGLPAVPCLAQGAVERLLEDRQREVSKEIEKLSIEDQAEGSPEFMPEVQRRAWEKAHEQRVLRMREIVRTEKLETLPDLFNAALLLHHGLRPEDFLTAHVLFTTAAFKGSESAKWLSAASLDRYLGWTDRPFLFYLKPGQPNLITDDLRKFYCVLPVAEQQRDERDIQRQCMPKVTDRFIDGRPPR